MSKPKYIAILMRLFCSIVASRTSHFESFFPANDLAGIDLGMTTMSFGWQAKPRQKYSTLFSGFRHQILSGSLMGLGWPRLSGMAHVPSHECFLYFFTSCYFYDARKYALMAFLLMAGSFGHGEPDQGE